MWLSPESGGLKIAVVECDNLLVAQSQSLLVCTVVESYNWGLLVKEIVRRYDMV